MCLSRFQLVVGFPEGIMVRVRDADGVERVTSLLAFEGAPPVPGEWLVVHAGYALGRVEAEEAEQAIAEYAAAVARSEFDRHRDESEENR